MLSMIGEAGGRKLAARGADAPSAADFHVRARTVPLPVQSSGEAAGENGRERRRLCRCRDATTVAPMAAAPRAPDAAGGDLRVTSRLPFQVHMQRISCSRDEGKPKG